jgi:DNA-directed RNA polymerase subunit RPC12/RpoP
MADKTLVCRDCSKEFIFTEGEQTFYQEKGLQNEPQRCPDCRKIHKQQRNAQRGYGRRDY